MKEGLTVDRSFIRLVKEGGLSLPGPLEAFRLCELSALEAELLLNQPKEVVLFTFIAEEGIGEDVSIEKDFDLVLPAADMWDCVVLVRQLPPPQRRV